MPPLEGDDEQVVGAPASALDGEANTSGGGHIFLLLDLPPNTTVGCDARAIGTGPSPFRGLRDIPPGGAHFIWVSTPAAMSRCGYWFVTRPLSGAPTVRIKQWDAFNEILVTPPSAFEVRNLRADVAELHSQLVPYGFEGVAGDSTSASSSSRLSASRGHHQGDQDAAQLWQRLTTCINEKVLGRVCAGRARAEVDAASEWLVDTSDSAVGDNAGALVLPQHTTRTTTQTLVGGGGSGELQFLLPEGDVDVHTVAASHTAGSVDSVPDTSMDIIRLIDTPGTGLAEEDLLGELQFTFLTGLHLSNLACVEQWWHLVLKVVLRAHKLVVLRPQLSRALLETFHAQMVYNDKYMGGSSGQQPTNAGRDWDDDDDNDDDRLRQEYGGAGDATSLLDVIPGNKRRLREALRLYKRRLNELLVGGEVTPEQSEVVKAFSEVQEWVSRLGWDLRTEYVRRRRESVDREEEGLEEEDEYRPVIVDLDGDGREVGLVSFS